MNLLFEDMIRAETEQYICRIWRQAHGVSFITNEMLKEQAVILMEGGHSPKIITGTLAQYDKVNSVEVIDRVTGCGVCVHKDWP